MSTTWLQRVLALATTGGVGALLGGAVLFGSMVWRLYKNQESLLYYPVIPGLPWRRVDDSPAPFNSPSHWAVRHEEVWLTASDGVRLHGWFVHAAGDGGAHAPTIVFFHANAGHAGWRLPNVAALARAVPANVFLWDYRGYGNSDGSPTEEGLQRDARAVMDHVAGRPDVDQGRVFLFGRSLGGAVATFAAAYAQTARSEASLPPLAGVILENTFSSIDDMVDVVMPFLAPLKRWVLRMHWPTAAVLPTLPAELPVLLISGERDALVPPAMMRSLESAARARAPSVPGAPPGAVRFYAVPGASHDDCAVKGGLEYMGALRRFLDEAMTAAHGRGRGLDLAGPPHPVVVPPGVPRSIVPGIAHVDGEDDDAVGGTGGGVQQQPPLAGVGVPVAVPHPAAPPRGLPAAAEGGDAPEAAAKPLAPPSPQEEAAAAAPLSEWELLGEDGSDVMETLRRRRRGAEGQGEL
jgi:abhydrolase domain-containing protein 13